MAEWFDKFKVGQEVRVVKKVAEWEFSNGRGCSWYAEDMDRTIGKIYIITEIDKRVGYGLCTQIPNDYTDELYDYWYPAESLEEVRVKGRQLLFSFMNE